MVYVDLGGTKTLVKFDNKKDFEKFLSLFKKEEIERNDKENYIIFHTSYLQNENKFFSFIKMLKDNFDEVNLIFPELIFNGKVYSKKFPFLNGKAVDELKNKGIDKIIQDIKALTYYYADKFFKKNNKEKKLCVVILGTGVNAIALSYWEFKEKIFLDKLYESGHLTFVYDGKMCHCGREGCFERYLSGKYLKDELKVEEITSINHIPNKKQEFHKRLAYYLSSLLISQGVDKFVLYGGLTNIIDLELLKNYITGVLPFNVEMEVDVEIDNDPLAQIKGLMLLNKSKRDNQEENNKEKKSANSNKNGKRKRNSGKNKLK